MIEVLRTIGGETVAGYKVAAWKYRDTHDDPRLNPRACFHWSTPGASAADVERLFTETDLRSLLTKNAHLERRVDVLTKLASLQSTRVMVEATRAKDAQNLLKKLVARCYLGKGGKPVHRSRYVHFDAPLYHELVALNFEMSQREHHAQEANKRD